MDDNRNWNGHHLRLPPYLPTSHSPALHHIRQAQKLVLVNPRHVAFTIAFRRIGDQHLCAKFALSFSRWQSCLSMRWLWKGKGDLPTIVSFRVFYERGGKSLPRSNDGEWWWAGYTSIEKCYYGWNEDWYCVNIYCIFVHFKYFGC